jgi:hypothetical protein
MSFNQVVAGLTLFVVSYVLGAGLERYDFQNRAVRAGVGRFNEKTAAFEWIYPDVEPEYSFGVGVPVEVYNDWKCK